MLSVRGLVEVGKALAKGFVIGGFALAYLLWVQDSVVTLGTGAAARRPWRTPAR